MLTIPNQLKRNMINIYGDKGEQWIPDLPILLTKTDR